MSSAGSEPIERHGGNLAATARRLGCRPDQLLDASASLVPFAPPAALLRALRTAPLRAYPDRTYASLRGAIARLHGLEPALVLPGNGAAELFTWVARDAASAGVSLLSAPGFADYERALACWGGAWSRLPLALDWSDQWPQPFPDPGTGQAAADVLWVTNPHNPTGQLWSRSSLEALLGRFALVIVDEAFLPLVPGGEAESLLPLVADHPNLVVIRSLTKLFAIAGLRLGYAV
ncbi:MAG: aminotransferase class I/II-fold pyridoxal phosphate-dependent enzyme, partial [Prochlorococcaceae cyanobacterium]